MSTFSSEIVSCSQEGLQADRRCSYLNDNGGTDPNDSVGNAGAKLLIADIDDTKQMLSDLGVDLPVGNSDAGSYFNDQVLESVDYGVRTSLGRFGIS